MASEERTPVPRQNFKLIKDKMWRHIRILKAHFTAFDADGTTVEREDIQKTLNQAFEKCQELLNQLEIEMSKQVEYEVAVQRLNRGYVDELLHDMTESFHKFSVTIAECSVMLNKCTKSGTNNQQPGVHAVIEGDPETGLLTYERKDEILIMPNPSHTPLMFIKIKKPADDEEITAFGMPDTGSHRNLCSEDFANAHGLEIDHKLKTNLKAANGQHLSCIGATKADVSYHGVQLLLTIYVMKDVPSKYIIISKDACQGFGILPKQFPLPLRLCELPPTEIQHKTKTQNVPDLNQVQNERKRTADRTVQIPEKTNKMAKTRTEEMTPRGNIGINVTASLNDDENKSYV